MRLLSRDTGLIATVRNTLSLLLIFILILSGALPLVVQGDDSGEGAAITITMTGETGQVEFDLTITSGQGGVVEVPGEGVFTYVAGTVVELEAVPEDGFQFAGWASDVDPISDASAARTSIVVDADYSITATFESEPVSPAPPAQYVLVVKSTVGGNVTAPGEGDFAYDGGTEVDLVAAPMDGYRFSEWTGDVSTVADVDSGETSIIMDGDYDIVAGFDPVPVPASSAFPWWWILIGIVIVGLLVYSLWWRRQARAADSAGPE